MLSGLMYVRPEMAKGPIAISALTMHTDGAFGIGVQVVPVLERVPDKIYPGTRYSCTSTSVS